MQMSNKLSYYLSNYLITGTVNLSRLVTFSALCKLEKLLKILPITDLKQKFDESFPFHDLAFKMLKEIS